jgi:hypothetical protein
LQALPSPQAVPFPTAAWVHAPPGPHASAVQGLWSSHVAAVETQAPVWQMPAPQAPGDWQTDPFARFASTQPATGSQAPT